MDTIPNISVTLRVVTGARPADVLDHYSATLTRFGATVHRTNDGHLAFDMALDRPNGLGLWEADLGLISGGTVEAHPEQGGVRVRLVARPRVWFTVLAFVPWLLLIWALGWTEAPWRWLLAFGGLPLPILLWLLAWLNLDAFLEETRVAFKAQGGGSFPSISS